MNDYSKIPQSLGIIPCIVEEYFLYQYLPIKLPNQSSLCREKRLEVFDRLIGRACCDFIGEYGLDRYTRSYIYLTAKHRYQTAESGINRPGWHTDGFGTDDISYIWSNVQPTIFNTGPFNLSSCDLMSMVEMEKQADPKNNYSYANNTLLRLDQNTVHKVADEYIVGNRAFFKLCVSDDIYNLKGNSINYEMKEKWPDLYNWTYINRNTVRNIPQTNKHP